MLTVPGGPAPQTNRHVTNLVFFIAFNLCVVPGPARADTLMKYTSDAGKYQNNKTEKTKKTNIRYLHLLDIICTLHLLA